MKIFLKKLNNKLNKENIKNKKIVAIVGQTATGKSELAVLLAKKFNGEIISVDSRQVYKYLDLGTGKVKVKPCKKDNKKLCYKNIPHYLIDVASPKKNFSVTTFQKLALKAIRNILKRNKLPILCGGTPFYFYALIEGYVFPKVKPDYKLRKKLEKKEIKELLEILKKLDKKTYTQIDKKNKRRIIRAIEIVKELNKRPKLEKKPLPYPLLILGLKRDKKILKKLIYQRLIKRLKQGMLKEVKDLKNKHKISFKRLESFGLEYRYLSLYLQKKLKKQEMIEQLTKAILDFSKRQLTWFKKDKRIIWLKNKNRAFKLVNQFLK